MNNQFINYCHLTKQIVTKKLNNEKPAKNT